MNLDRIRSSIDVERMPSVHACVVGGAYGLAQDLVRCGLGAITLVDVGEGAETHPARQDVDHRTASQRTPKIQACAGQLRTINPWVRIETLQRDFCSLAEEEIDAHFGATDLFVFATDSFAAQARGNLVALRLGVPAVWIGMYAGGRAGEIVFHAPGMDPPMACYRCICSARYAAYARGGSGGGDRTSSDGGTIFDLRLVDAVAGPVAVGLLTRGADNRFGRLIDDLGRRNLLQVKMDPRYTLGGRDIFRQYLGDHPANFSFTTIALPMEPEAGCPDCGGAPREA